MTSAAEAGPRLLVVGTGLIGTSVALAARRAGYQVFLDDVDDEALATACRMGAGERRPPGEPAVDVAVVAVPPLAISTAAAQVLRDAQATTVTHVGSVQVRPQLEVESILGTVPAFVGSHPIAGNERSGPAHASPDLFADRPWIVCPGPDAARRSTETVTRLAATCHADVVTMAPAAHDSLFAQLSHVPQLVASALVSPLDRLSPAEAALAGGGLRDSSRLADSSPRLWAEIVSANAAAVAAGLSAVLSPLEEISRLLAAGETEAAGQAVARLVERGRRGRLRIAGKHGQRPVRWATVAVAVPDEPGTLARLLADAATSGANVEDIRIDHVIDHPYGVIELSVSERERGGLHESLERLGWRVTSRSPSYD